MLSNTGRSSFGDWLMMRRISAVAVCLSQRLVTLACQQRELFMQCGQQRKREGATPLAHCGALATALRRRALSGFRHLLLSALLIAPSQRLRVKGHHTGSG